MNRTKHLTISFWLSLGCILATTGTGYAAEVMELPTIAVSESFRVEHRYSAPVAYDNFLYLYSELDDKLLIISSYDKNYEISTPYIRNVLTISETKSLAVLDGSIVLLLDAEKQQAIKIFGGPHHSSPRSPRRFRWKIGEYQFDQSKNSETKAVEITVSTEDKAWEPVTISGNFGYQKRLVRGEYEYWIDRSNIYVESNVDEAIHKIPIGNGAHEFSMLSEPHGLLGILVREGPHSAKIVLFNANKNSVIGSISVGGYAFFPAILGRKLYIFSFMNLTLSVVDIGDLLDEMMEVPR